MGLVSGDGDDFAVVLLAKPVEKALRVLTWAKGVDGLDVLRVSERFGQDFGGLLRADKGAGRQDVNALDQRVKPLGGLPHLGDAVFGQRPEVVVPRPVLALPGRSVTYNQ